MIKIGIIGCGMIAERGHLPALQNVPGLQPYALFDANFERAKTLQHQFHIPHAFPSKDGFYASDIDAIVICTPAPIHYSNVMDAAKYHKHVLCEKPLGMSEDEMIAMEDVMRKAGLQLFTGFNYRFSQCALDIKKLIHEKSIGEVRLLRLIYNWHLHGKWIVTEHGEQIASPLRVGRMHEGGPLVDCEVHQIDLARWWLQSEVHSHTGIGVWLDSYEAPDHVYLHMDHESGAHSMIEMSFSYNATSRELHSNFQYEILGTDGVIRYNREEHSFTIRNSQGPQYLPWHPEKSFPGMYLQFSKALHGGRSEEIPTARDGIIASRIAQAAIAKAIQNRKECSRNVPVTALHAGQADEPTDELPIGAMHLPLNPQET